MALWGISTTTETSDNNYAIPKFLQETDRNNTPHNCFADVRGWVYRKYGTTEQSGLSVDYCDDVIVPVAGLNTAGSSSDTGATGLGLATPVAVFFEDVNLASPISIGAGGTTGITTGSTGYVHLVFNELVYVSAGSTITAGIAATFSTRTNATKLFIDVPRGFIGVITDVSGGAGVTSSFTSDIIRNVGGAGTVFSGVGIGTTTLTVTA